MRERDVQLPAVQPAAEAPPGLSEVLELLWQSALDGSVGAQLGLARLLAARADDPVKRRRDELAARRRAREAS